MCTVQYVRQTERIGQNHRTVTMATWQKKFPFKNETQVDLDGFDAKNRVTSDIFIWINRSKCNLINSLWVFDDISHIHWDIVVCRTPIFNAIMHIFSKKSARLLFARLSKVACRLFSFSYLPVFVAFSPFFLTTKKRTSHWSNILNKKMKR